MNWGDDMQGARRPGVSITSLSAGYGANRVVSDVSFEVGRGEFVGIIGPNGAGKSTLLKAITGVAATIAGRIEIEGRLASELDARLRARLVAVVPQSLPEPFSFSAREFVEMGRYPYLGRFDRMSPEDRHAVEQALIHTDTLDLEAEAVDTLSGGDLQRLTLAQALAQEPSVLLLDEPTSHLDLNHQLQVLDLVRSRVTAGLAVLGVFHDIGLAARYADRIAVVSEGRLRAIGPPAEVVTPEVLREVFGVRAVVGSDPVTGTVSVTPVLREEAAERVGRGKVLVIGGSGAAATIMRDLVQAGFEVVAGALNEGDVDQAVAQALGIEHVMLPPFGEMDRSAEDRVRAAAASVQTCIVSEVPFGRANIGNLRAVVESGTRTILLGSVEVPVDFTGGEAKRLLDRLASEGAVRIAIAQEAVQVLIDDDDAGRTPGHPD